jgi:serine/threonine protein kinase
MARTYYRTSPPPGHAAAAASLGPPTPLVPGWSLPYLHNVDISQLVGDEPGSELLMRPVEYEDREDIGEDAEWREAQYADRCWKTTEIYQHISHHPNVVRFLRPDSWTWLPVLANPGGPHLEAILKANRTEMYEQRENDSTNNKTIARSRVRTKHLNLVHQWAIHLAKALEHIHSYSFDITPVPKISIVFGDLSIEKCWLSPSGTTLSLLGFLDAGYRTRSSPLHVGDHSLSTPWFNPLSKNPTMQTDLFPWGSVVYELMTGHWPGQGQGLEWQDADMLVSRREWPRLETMCLGDVVRKCWADEITSAAELVVAVRKAVTNMGVVLGDEDEILNLGLEGLKIQPDADAHEHD